MATFSTTIDALKMQTRRFANHGKATVYNKLVVPIDREHQVITAPADHSEMNCAEKSLDAIISMISPQLMATITNYPTRW